MPAAASSILDSFSALADATRCRMLRLLESHELTVSELCGVLQLPQSTVSRHLKTLADAGWVTSRRDGTSRYYSLALDGAGWPASAALAADARSSSTAVRRRSGRAPPRARAGPPQRDVAAVLRHVGGAVGPAARRAVRPRLRAGRRCSGCCRPTGSSAIWAAAPARCCRRSRRTWRASSAWTRRTKCWPPRARAPRRSTNVELRRGSLEALPIDDARSTPRR